MTKIRVLVADDHAVLRTGLRLLINTQSDMEAVAMPLGRNKAATAVESLSEREREVFEMVARGHTSQAIADKLFLSVKTVESYRARLMAKLGLQNRAELTQLALDLGVLGQAGSSDS